MPAAALFPPGRRAYPRRASPWLLMLLLVVLGGCQKAEDPLRIGINPWPGYDYLYLAAQKGWFREAGVAVDLVEFTSLGDSRRAFERGQTDVLGGTVVELLLMSHHSERRPRAFYAVNWSRGADEILARAPIRSVRDLEGKRVGVEPASLDLLVLAVALERNGLPFSAVERVPMPQAEMPAALAKDRIQAAVTYPPASLDILQRVRSRSIFSTAEAPHTVLDLLITDVRILENRPEDLVRVVRTFQRALRYAEAHPDEAHGIMARREGLPPSGLRRLLEGLEVLGLAEQKEIWAPGGPVPTNLARSAAILRAAHQLDGETPEVANLLDARIIRRAAENR
ncbi:ABC transporter substrate-binding protein [Thiohalorhabdus methylotrophus]|uniref:ABC transporter substrate-binding protein n=1 Tax=Thiohalorhabdus methylotrophus TaxID=3242694 RepID=A0ABV4TTB4_9GAMM